MFTPRDRDRCQRLFDKYYSSRRFKDSIYRDQIATQIYLGARLLDAGCGRYLRFSKEFADIATIIGVDLESSLDTFNDRSPFGVRSDLNHLPFPSESFDLVISRSVIEHLETPVRVFQEFHRVLRPGGKVILLTPNKYDYVSLIAHITPYRWHRYLVSRIFRVPEHDVYPTLYRANTPRALRKALSAAGLKEAELDTINHYPAYLMFSPILFRLGMLYERLTALRVFRILRGSILCVFEKENVQNRADFVEAPVATGAQV